MDKIANLPSCIAPTLWSPSEETTDAGPTNQTDTPSAPSLQEIGGTNVEKGERSIEPSRRSEIEFLPALIVKPDRFENVIIESRKALPLNARSQVSRQVRVIGLRNQPPRAARLFLASCHRFPGRRARRTNL